MHGNPIGSIPERFFEYTPGLKRVHLNRLNLTSVRSDLFRNQTAELLFAPMNGNPIDCRVNTVGGPGAPNGTAAVTGITAITVSCDACYQGEAAVVQSTADSAATAATTFSCEPFKLSDLAASPPHSLPWPRDNAVFFLNETSTMSGFALSRAEMVSLDHPMHAEHP